jgi:hypothetical protein
MGILVLLLDHMRAVLMLAGQRWWRTLQEASGPVEAAWSPEMEVLRYLVLLYGSTSAGLEPQVVREESAAPDLQHWLGVELFP